MPVHKYMLNMTIAHTHTHTHTQRQRYVRKLVVPTEECYRRWTKYWDKFCILHGARKSKIGKIGYKANIGIYLKQDNINIQKCYIVIEAQAQAQAQAYTKKKIEFQNKNRIRYDVMRCDETVIKWRSITIIKLRLRIGSFTHHHFVILFWSPYGHN